MVPLSAGACSDWRASLRADFSDPLLPRFAGAYPAACGERTWPLAFADPPSYAARTVAGLWHEIGGRTAGEVRDGVTPPTAVPLAETVSPTLAEVVRDINKFSNNVMAQQVFLTLSLQHARHRHARGLARRAGHLVARTHLARRAACSTTAPACRATNA